MVTPIHTNAGSEVDKLNEIDSFASLENASLRTAANPRKKREYHNDDVIMSLVNAYENQRARQVVEWERLYRKSVAA